MTNTTEEVQDPQAVLAALRAAQEDIKHLRGELTSLTEQRDALETEKSRLSELASGDEWRGKALTAETRLALASQGIKDVDRLMKYVGTDGLDFDDQGKVTGLDDRLNELKKDLPEIFDAKVRAGGKADIFADNAVEPKENPLRQNIRAALTGQPS